MGYPPDYPQQPQQPPARKRRGLKVVALGCGGLIALIVILIIVIGGVAALNHSHAPATSAAPSGGTGTTGSAAPRPAGIGTPVSDGKFRFTITKITHQKRAGGQYGSAAAGLYTVVHLTVTNTGNESQTLDDSDQHVFDGRGRKFSADTTADLYANGGGNSSSFFLNDVNPGTSVHGVILFDLPRGDKAVKAELHDSPFSGGVTVSLARS